jgi:hypothetical protein
MPKTIDYALCQDCTVAAANDDYSGMSEDQAYRTRANLKRVGWLALLSSEDEQATFECDVCGKRVWEGPKNMFRGTKHEERTWTHTSQRTCSDDGLWMRRIDANTMAVVCFEYWENLDSSAIETHGQYNVQSGTVELDHRDLHSALSYVGLRILNNGQLEVIGAGDLIAQSEPAYFYAIAEALWTYGAKCINHDESGNNRRKLIRGARNFAA